MHRNDKPNFGTAPNRWNYSRALEFIIPEWTEVANGTFRGDWMLFAT